MHGPNSYIKYDLLQNIQIWNQFGLWLVCWSGLSGLGASKSGRSFKCRALEVYWKEHVGASGQRRCLCVANLENLAQVLSVLAKIGSTSLTLALINPSAMKPSYSDLHKWISLTARSWEVDKHTTVNTSNVDAQQMLNAQSKRYEFQSKRNNY